MSAIGPSFHWTHKDLRREMPLSILSDLTTAEVDVVMAALPLLPTEDMDQ